MRAWLASIAAATFSLSGIADVAAFDEPFKLPDSELEPLTWAQIDGWTADDHLAAFNAFQVSCQPFRKIREPHDERPVYNALWQVCRRAATVKPANAQAARAFFSALAACFLDMCLASILLIRCTTTGQRTQRTDLRQHFFFGLSCATFVGSTFPMPPV